MNKTVELEELRVENERLRNKVDVLEAVFNEIKELKMKTTGVFIHNLPIVQSIVWANMQPNGKYPDMMEKFWLANRFLINEKNET